MKSIVLATAVLLAWQKGGDAPADSPVRPILERHCRECHGPDKPKAKFCVDELTPDFGNGANRDRWLTVVKRVQAGEMPPKAKPRLDAKEVETLADWVNGSAAAARSAEGRVVLR